MGFFEAYRERLENNHKTFIEMAKELTNKGCSVYITTDRLVSSLYVEKDGNHIYFGFTDVPYRWYLHYDIDARLNMGSGRSLKEIHGTENPYSPDFIIESLQPIPEKRTPGPKPTSYRKLYVNENNIV